MCGVIMLDKDDDRFGPPYSSICPKVCDKCSHAMRLTKADARTLALELEHAGIARAAALDAARRVCTNIIACEFADWSAVLHRWDDENDEDAGECRDFEDVEEVART